MFLTHCISFPILLVILSTISGFCLFFSGTFLSFPFSKGLRSRFVTLRRFHEPLIQLLGLTLSFCIVIIPLYELPETELAKKKKIKKNRISKKGTTVPAIVFVVRSIIIIRSRARWLAGLAVHGLDGWKDGKLGSCLQCVISHLEWPVTKMNVRFCFLVIPYITLVNRFSCNSKSETN